MGSEIAITHTTQDIERMAIAMHKSGLYGFKDANQYMALMFIAQAESRHPATVVQDYHFFNGKAALKSEAALARHLEAGGTVTWKQNSSTVCEAEFSHPKGGKYVSKFTIEDAKKAGLTGKDVWIKYPEDLLRARVIGRGVRAVNPGALRGTRVYEEVMGDPEEAPEAPAPDPSKPVIPRASEMAAAAQPSTIHPEPAAAPAAHPEASEAEFEPVAPTTPAAPAALPAEPVKPPPPPMSIRIKDSVIAIPAKEIPGATPGGPESVRYGIKTANNGMLGTFSPRAHEVIKPIIEADSTALIDMAFISIPIPGTDKTRNDLVWVEGVIL